MSARWVPAVLEQEAGALLRAKQFDRAEQVFRDALTRNPNNGRSLYGLWQAQLSRKDRAAAATEKLFHEAWKHADVSLQLEDF